MAAVMPTTLILSYREGRDGAPYLEVVAWGDTGGGRYGSVTRAVLAISDPAPRDPEELLSVAMAALSACVQS